jgi:RNA polymerase sigma factor for flagellar operon FliA
MDESTTQLIEQHRDYVRGLAKQIARQLPPDVDMQELIASGEMGLVQAAERYDPTQGVAFQTFAYYRIRGAIYDGLRKMLWLPPTLYKQIRFQAGADEIAKEQLAESGLDDDPDAQADRLATAVRDLAAIYILSLERVEGEPEPASDDDNPADTAERHEDVERLRGAIESLPERKQRVIRGYYFEGRKLTEIAGDLGVSRFQASRLHTEAVRELRRCLESDRDDHPP